LELPLFFIRRAAKPRGGNAAAGGKYAMERVIGKSQNFLPTEPGR